MEQKGPQGTQLMTPASFVSSILGGEEHQGCHAAVAPDEGRLAGAQDTSHHPRPPVLPHGRWPLAAGPVLGTAPLLAVP